MSKLNNREEIADALEQYQKKNICEFAYNQCKGCTFSIET